MLQFLDKDGLLHFKPSVHVRKLINAAVINEMPAQIKLMMYGVGVYQQDHEFNLIFEQLVQNKQVTGVFGLIETKVNKIHECYAGDLLYDNRGERLESFREILIREHITYPSKVRTDLNQLIFRERAAILCRRNSGLSIIPENPQQDLGIAGGNERFEFRTVIGEGHVIITFRSRLCYVNLVF